MYKDFNLYNGIYKVDVYDNQPLVGNLHDGVSSGISMCQFLAALVAYVEYFERKAVMSSGILYSNGCPAQPILFNKEKAYSVACRRAYNESVERYSLHEWFFDHSIRHTHLPEDSFLQSVAGLVQNKKGLGQIRIDLCGTKNFILSYIKLEKGLIFGTAVDDNIENAKKRSISELLRNSLSFLKSIHEKHISRPDYEILSLGIQGNMLIDRINHTGQNKLYIPKPQLTHEIQHEHQDKVVVVRSIISDKRYSKQQLCDQYSVSV